MTRAFCFSSITLLWLFFIPMRVVSADEAITVDHMTKCLAFGQLIELNNKDRQSDEPLILRLWQIPSDNSNACTPETDAECGSVYFLSVATLDDYPEVRFYRLPHSRELRDFLAVKWLPLLSQRQIDRARIQLTFSSVRRTSKPLRFVLDIGLDGIQTETSGNLGR